MWKGKVGPKREIEEERERGRERSGKRGSERRREEMEAGNVT